jgi:hypothetical protein
LDPIRDTDKTRFCGRNLVIRLQTQRPGDVNRNRQAFREGDRQGPQCGDSPSSRGRSGQSARALVFSQILVSFLPQHASATFNRRKDQPIHDDRFRFGRGKPSNWQFTAGQYRKGAADPSVPTNDGPWHHCTEEQVASK